MPTKIEPKIADLREYEAARSRLKQCFEDHGATPDGASAKNRKTGMATAPSIIWWYPALAKVSMRLGDQAAVRSRSLSSWAHVPQTAPPAR